ncbi:MAG TPA: hypothetical protein VGD42_19860 [Lysobacter sp.]
MNTPDQRTPDDRSPNGWDDTPPSNRPSWRNLDALRLEAEWQAQERALEQERRGVPLDAADPRLAEYRLIARALRNPAMEPVPADLAAQIVQHVTVAQGLGEVLERWLLRVLGIGLALVALVAVAAYGTDWAPAFSDLVPRWSPRSADWSGVVIGCLALSLAWQGVVRAMRAVEPLQAA